VIPVIFEPTPLEGLLIVRPEKFPDNRGFFARLWDEEAFAAAGHPFRPTQISVSHNAHAGTLRGLHWQREPHGETKLVRASCGRIYDVAVDLRRGSPTFCCWFSVELDADFHAALLIPAGFAHGFVTLTHDAEVIYCIHEPFVPDAAAGARYDDPAFGIVWPVLPTILSDRDRTWPAFPLGPGDA
jgi:dTDP-4-dehydrorhamnose 3,5-epimerase